MGSKRTPSIDSDIRRRRHPQRVRIVLPFTAAAERRSLGDGCFHRPVSPVSTADCLTVGVYGQPPDGAGPLNSCLICSTYKDSRTPRRPSSNFSNVLQGKDVEQSIVTARMGRLTSSQHYQTAKGKYVNKVEAAVEVVVNIGVKLNDQVRTIVKVETQSLL